MRFCANRSRVGSKRSMTPTSRAPVASRRASRASKPHRDYVRLLMWEALENVGKDSVAEESARRAFYQSWIAQVRTAQQHGEIADDLDPAELVLSEVALTMFPLAFPQVTRMITGTSEHGPKFASAHSTFLRSLGARLNASPNASKPSTNPDATQPTRAKRVGRP